MSDNSRDPKGKYKAGNPGGPGRPRRPVEDEYLATFNAVLTLERWQAIIERAIQDAANGDARARSFVATYALGDKPSSLKKLAANEMAGVSVDESIQAQSDMIRLVRDDWEPSTGAAPESDHLPDMARLLREYGLGHLSSHDEEEPEEDA